MSIDGRRGGFSVSALAAHRDVAVDSVDADEDSDVESDDDDERHDAVRDEFQVLEDVRREHRSIVFADWRQSAATSNTRLLGLTQILPFLQSSILRRAKPMDSQTCYVFDGPVTPKIAPSSWRPQPLPNT